MFVAQGIVCAGVGTVALYITRRYTRPQIHEIVASHTLIAQEAPQIAEILSRLVILNDPAELHKAMDKIEEVLTLSKHKKKSNQWHISRINGDVIRQIKAMCDAIPMSTVDDDMLHYILLIRDEYIPQLISLLDDRLHNHLLDQ